jgi:hypothetical protein
MENKDSNLPTWILGDESKEYFGISHDSLKRLRKSGALVKPVHYLKTGPHPNSKYRYHVENCLDYFKSH